MHVGDYTLEDTVTVPFTTRAFATGAPTALSSGAVEIYEDSGTTQITAAETLTADFDSVTGLNMVSVAATSANGFENGKSYTLVLSAGTVDSVSVVGEVVGHFTIGRSAAAVDLANGTDGLGAIKSDTAAILTDTGEIGAAGAGLTEAGGDGDHLTEAGGDGDHLTEAGGDGDHLTGIPILTTAHSEPSGVPAANETLADKIGYLFMALRNRVDVTATKKTFYDDSDTSEWEKDVSDDGTTYSESEGNAI